MGKSRFIFDSFFRHSGSNSNPRFNIPNVGIVARSFYVNKISIPYTFYNINNNNNKINWTDSLGVELTSELPVGDYHIDDLLIEIGTQLSTDATDSLTYSLSVNERTKKVTITNSGSSNFTIRKDTTKNNYTSFFVMMGFYDAYTDQMYGDYNRISELTGSSSYTANDSYYITIRNIYVKSSLINKSKDCYSYAFYNHIDDSNPFYTSTGYNNILATIPVSNVMGDLIVYRETTENDTIILNSGALYPVSDIEFELISGEYYNQLDLNGRNWIIEVTFNT